jgi:dienelactone hydrolase
MVVLEYARSGSPISGVVNGHGSLDTTRPAEPSSIRARILVCHGALDPHVPMSQVTAFAEKMKRAGADSSVLQGVIRRVSRTHRQVGCARAQRSWFDGSSNGTSWRATR